MHYAGQDPDPDNVSFDSVKKGYRFERDFVTVMIQYMMLWILLSRSVGSEKGETTREAAHPPWPSAAAYQ